MRLLPKFQCCIVSQNLDFSYCENSIITKSVPQGPVCAKSKVFCKLGFILKHKILFLKHSIMIECLLEVA
ncbi:unnamed protein product [Moneuplotes crassus]|uniref:Uncharacterized protein n=1 Tax=Euplotes crassus TaxID=5936 RepID=A0AAD1XRG8_EUPCR|nr:unnamed protein product [Moneuplotes crassus]